MSRSRTYRSVHLTAEVQHIRKKHLLITNRLRTDTVVYIRHTLEKGWVQIEAPLSSSAELSFSDLRTMKP